MNGLVSELKAKVPNWQNFGLNFEPTGKLKMLMRDEEVLPDRETEGCCLSPAALAVFQTNSHSIHTQW